MTEPLDLKQLAQQAAELAGLTAEQVPGLLRLFEMVDREAHVRGYRSGAADVETLRARVLELQGELGEIYMERDREKADTTIGGG